MQCGRSRRARFASGPVVAGVIAGVPLPALARAAQVPLWLRVLGAQRIATLPAGRNGRSPLPNILQLEPPRNQLAPVELWRTAHKWLRQHDLTGDGMAFRTFDLAQLDRAVWTGLWRAYWLAKGRIPAWLPLGPSWTVINSMQMGACPAQGGCVMSAPTATEAVTVIQEEKS